MKLYLTHQYFKLYLFLKNDVYEFITGLQYVWKRGKQSISNFKIE